MDPYDAILSRRSVRSYRPDPVSRELLAKVIDAGRLAPTARNEQPWEFVVVTDKAKLRQIADITDHGKFIADAPACVVVLCRAGKYYLEDGSAATTQMMLAARALGLGTCWVAGDKKDYAPQIVQLTGAPGDFKLVALVAVGYAVDDAHQPKRAIDDVLHWETF
jgi:nitroreductase